MEYDEDFLRSISEKVDLAEYIGRTTELEKKGKDYFCRCSKHVDKTPSFSITPEKNSFYCFSCGRGGGIIQYLQDYEGLNFDDAVRKTCELAKTDLSTMCYSPTVRFLKTVRKLKSRNVPVEHRILDESEYEKYSKEPVQEWMQEGIRQREIGLFDIRIDHRSNRIVYPVRDIDGNLINVKGRTRFKDYKEMGLMKYINYYPIGTMDYIQGLNITLPYIKERNEIILFESLKSVMKCYGWSYKNCGSAEKHTLTPEQIRLLIRLKVDITFAYDSDVSYLSKDALGTIRTLKRFTNVYVIEDPDNLLGGTEGKNSPADKGLQVFERLYQNKRRVR